MRLGEGFRVWKDNVIVNGVIFRIYHSNQHPMGQLLAASTCTCGALLDVECSVCGAPSVQRVPKHPFREHAEAA